MSDLEEKVYSAVETYFKAFDDIQPSLAVRHLYFPSCDIVEKDLVSIFRYKKDQLQQELVKFATDRYKRSFISKRIEFLSDNVALVWWKDSIESERFTGEEERFFILCQDKYGLWKIASSYTKPIPK